MRVMTHDTGKVWSPCDECGHRMAIGVELGQFTGLEITLCPSCLQDACELLDERLVLALRRVEGGNEA